MRGGQLSEERMLSKGISKLIRANCHNTLPEKVSRATQPRVQDLLDFRTAEGALRAQSCMLTNPKLNTHLLAREVETVIWPGRNVMLHPKSQLIAPVFVGENCRVGAGAKIGPNAVISCDSIVDTGTTVQHSAIYPGTYCGQGLSLNRVFVDRNRLFDCRLESQLNVSDSFILSALKGDQRHWTRSAISMIAAATLSVVTVPIVLVTVLVLWMKRGKDVFRHKRVLRVPASEDQANWRFFYLWSFRDPSTPRKRGLIYWFLLDCIPALPSVASGDLHLIGVEPRTRQELEEMPEDWKTLYLKAHIGLITEAFVLHGSNATADQTYSSEVYYAAMADIRHDLALAIRFVTRTLTAQQEF
jgi:lipopolysaccharide/colanic/teichoic acid biosynthesis glycosyltransferase